VTERLDAALETGWSVLVREADNCCDALTTLSAYDDRDDDAIAAVTFALGAVEGRAGDAWHAVARCIDTAFERVDYPADAREFRPLTQDIVSQPVQDELRWQDDVLTVLERSGATDDVISALRAGSA
jgi:hypothetical protein